MPESLLIALRLPWTLPRSAWRWAKKKAADRQVFVSAGATVVADVQEFLGRATPLAVSLEQHPGEINARLRDLEQEWRGLRQRLRRYTNGHHSDRIRRLGPELIEKVEKLMQGLRYMSSMFTDVTEKAAVSASVFALHERTLELADDLLREVHRS
jgi:hypothetical protein